MGKSPINKHNSILNKKIMSQSKRGGGGIRPPEPPTPGSANAPYGKSTFPDNTKIMTDVESEPNPGDKKQ